MKEGFLRAWWPPLQVLESLRSDARAAEQAHSEAVAAARAGEARAWQQRLQQAESAAQQQVPASNSQETTWTISRKDP